jgi:myo-inositol-1(or 4)-monophosphatase
MKLGQAELQEIQSWLLEVGQIALEGYPSAKTHLKEDRTPVTDEAMLVERLMRRYPHCQIISEEAGVLEDASDYVWALDPIDGTKPYVRGLPVWGISLGLLERGKPHTGFLYLPALNEFYLGGEVGAFWNGQRLRNFPGYEYDDPLSFVAVPSNTHLHYDIRYGRLQAFGCTAAHLGLVARRAAVAALTRPVYVWDIAGILPVLQQTGVVCEFFSGKELDLTSMLKGEVAEEALLAAQPRWLPQLRADIQAKKKAG